jgi:hypothetical protein
MWCSDWCPELQPRDGVQDPSFLSPVQTDLPRELVESLTRATQPVLVSPGGSDQAQRYHLASLSSESGESLRHIVCYPDKQTVEREKEREKERERESFCKTPRAFKDKAAALLILGDTNEY